MKRVKTSTIILLTFITLIAEAQQTNRTQWFTDARYGMFIHWGLYSAAEGIWKGENLRYLNNYAEWIRYRNRISKEEYGDLAKRFDWNTINPEEWVLLAKKAGMKYIIMTSKHHDGVALWDSKIGHYTLPKLAGENRDIIKELADACRKHSMKLGFYYSHWIDWEHPYAWDHNLELTKKVSDQQFNQYWQEKAIPQLRELLTNYGDIAIMWFDMWIPYEKTIFKKEQLEQAVALIRELQPNCLINSRLGLPTDAKYVDFETLGDNAFASDYIEHPWETPGTIAHSWGYNSQEKEWKSTSQLLQSLISNVSLNGGLTLNIGPRANGTVPYESISRLEEIGAWLESYGESVYSTKGLPLRSNKFDWGYLTSKKEKGKTKVYALVFNWPLDNILRITGIQSTPQKVQYQNGIAMKTLKFDQQGCLLHIHLPKYPTDKHVSCIVLEYDDTIATDRDIVAESTFGGFALKPSNVINKEDLKIIKYDGTRPTYFISNGVPAEWQMYFPLQGDYHVDLSAHNPTDKDIPIEVKIGSQLLPANLKPDGKVVVEPNEQNYTEEFVDRNIGKIYIQKPQKLKVTLRSLNNQPIWINRMWMKQSK